MAGKPYEPERAERRKPSDSFEHRDGGPGVRWLRVETFAVAVCADVGEDVARNVLGRSFERD